MQFYLKYKPISFHLTIYVYGCIKLLEKNTFMYSYRYRSITAKTVTTNLDLIKSRTTAMTDKCIRSKINTNHSLNIVLDISTKQSTHTRVRTLIRDLELRHKVKLIKNEDNVLAGPG